MYRTLSLALLGTALLTPVARGDGNRLAYLQESDPYYVGLGFPRLTTPQWVGEPGVEAVVVLAIDDMRGHEKWEAYLRPILERLKRIDGRAPVSIMTCRIDPKEPHLQKWLKEGVSLETHTYDHPCPILKGGDLAKAKETYDHCVDLLSEVPGSRPVAFRTPCCDSLNTPSPRLFAEIFNRTTPAGRFLTLDTSVFNIFTPDDPALPRPLVLEEGRSRFAKYLPRDRAFGNTIENYPYPYVLGRLCWEVPCTTPSDWQAQHLHRPNNPATVRDWEAALDATLVKQGIFCMVFHPHGWIRNDQVNELIDHAVAKHGRKVKFLTLRECQERLDRHLLGGHPLRAANGQDNGVRLLDLDADGHLDVVVGSDRARQTRVWDPAAGTWKVSDFPVSLVESAPDGERRDAGVRFGIVAGRVSLLVHTGKQQGGWYLDGKEWVKDDTLLAGLALGGSPVLTCKGGIDQGARLYDVDGDGDCELIVGGAKGGVFLRDRKQKKWVPASFSLPGGVTVVDGKGRDNGARFLDIDEDGSLDVLFSNEEAYSLHLFTSREKGWSQKVLAGKRGQPGEIPMITRKGTSNGAWVHSRSLWVQNEDTALFKDLVVRMPFNEMLRDVQPGPRSPQASLRSLKPRPGFVAELVASEPLVQDPVAFEWGPDGRLWVVEMGDYPLGVDGKGKPGGRVRVLEDLDGDGKYDKSTVFLDNLPFPTGVMPWRSGVLVTCAPDILQAADLDGDGRADSKLVLYSGFREGNQQHRVNTLAWGLDNWIHCANGDSGGEVESLKTRQKVDIRGRDLRIRPDTGELDTQTGQTQFGRTRDDWGSWFGGNNSNPMWHFVLADHYLRRNPHVAAPNLRVPVSVTPGNAPVFPRSRTLPRFNDFHTANRFTSACSPIVYRDELFGPAFAGNAFISEPVHNLVHREVMFPKGFTFASRRAEDEEQSEVLASSDCWFRPTMIRTGPDGAIYVADMYRHVIEHPQWIPKSWQEKLDLRAGHDRGRIYRIYPVGKRPRAIPRLDRLDTAGLVAALDSPSGWQRDMAQQMLLWRKDVVAVPALEKMALTGGRPQARLHALCTLDGLEGLRPELLARALADAHPGVRRHAVRLCEGRLTRSGELGGRLLALAADPDAQVRLQLACTLGEWDDARSGEGLARLLARDPDDIYLTAAVFSSIGKKNLDGVLAGVLREGGTPALLSRLLRLAEALGEKRALATLLQRVTIPEKGSLQPWQLHALASLLDSLEARGVSLEKLGAGDEPLARAVQQSQLAVQTARLLARETGTPAEVRAAALALLGRQPATLKDDLALLETLLTPQAAEQLQQAAITALGRIGTDEAAQALLKGWKSYTPALRAQVLEGMLQRRDGVGRLLDALASKQVQPFEIDTARRQRLLQHPDARLRARAEKLLAGSIDPNRQRLVQEYLTSKTRMGDPAQGQKHFTRLCAACHKLGDVGKPIGPDLAALTDKSPEALTAAILDPSRAVEAQFVGYLVETKRGQVLAGLLSAETATSLTLVAPDGKEQVLLRGDVDTLISTGKSAMPEGFEKELKPDDMADLLAFLRGR